MATRPVKFASAFAKENVVVQPLRVNEGGKGRTAWINMKNGSNVFEGVWNRVNWAPKPGMDQVKIDSFTKFKLTLQLDPETQGDFIDKIKELDDAVVEHFFNKKTEVWKEKAKFLNDKDSVMAMYNPLFKEGKTSGDGKSYKPSFTLQIPNCASLVEKLVIETKDKPDGTKQEQVQDVIWKTVTAKPGDKPDEKLPTFLLWTGVDADGKETAKTRVSVFRPDGSEVLDEKGVPVKRFVGLQDIKSGCFVKPVFTIKKAYVVANFGVHIELKAIMIKPAPPKESAEFDGVKITEEDDAAADAKVLSQLHSRQEIPDDAPPRKASAPEFDVEESVPPVPVPDASLASPVRKTKSSEAPSAPKKKRSKIEDEE